MDNINVNIEPKQKKMTERPIIVGICLVNFHHKRGPEVEYWYGLPEDTNTTDTTKLWPNLPFQALPDGSHSFEETFTYFTLLYNEKLHCSPAGDAVDLPEDELSDYTTFFAISCSRQIRATDLKHRSEDVTRSTVQKAIVVVSRLPIFGQIKDKLSIVTNAFFNQHDFTDKGIIVSLYDSLKVMYGSWDNLENSEAQLYMGLCLRKIFHDFKKDVLVLFKAILLEKKLIFYGSDVEQLCNLEFGLLSLVPLLILQLQRSGSPLLYRDPESVEPANSFKSSDRNSVLRFLGFPLLPFEKGGLFSPYTPLQQIGDIRSSNTKFFLIGTSNSLLYEQRNDLCDIFVNVDTLTVDVINKQLIPALQLTSHDKKWIDSMVAVVEETWNGSGDVETPKNSQFKGSEDFLRWQFEDYLTGLASSIKLDEYISWNRENQPSRLDGLTEDQLNNKSIQNFGIAWVNVWKQTQNFELFNRCTDDRLFDLFPPKHIYNGVDNFAIFQQKLASAFQNLNRKRISTTSSATAPTTTSIGNPSATRNATNVAAGTDDSGDKGNSNNNNNNSSTTATTTFEQRVSTAASIFAESFNKLTRISTGSSASLKSTDTSHDNEKVSTTKQAKPWNTWKELFKKSKPPSPSIDSSKEAESWLKVEESGAVQIAEDSSAGSGSREPVIGLGLREIDQTEEPGKACEKTSADTLDVKTEKEDG